MGAIQHRRESIVSSSRTTSFTGIGRTLSGRIIHPPPPQPLQFIGHTIIFWRNGFTVNDGPLRRMDDPENALFLEVCVSNNIKIALYSTILHLSKSFNTINIINSSFNRGSKVHLLFFVTTHNFYLFDILGVTYIFPQSKLLSVIAFTVSLPKTLIIKKLQKMK